jgi:AcrR family transcriptional regulator
MATIQLQLNKNLFLRDPQETELGRKIVHRGIELIDQIGFEKFTFKKLAAAIDSTEASVYRYFENKHRLLVYLIAWYWNWLEYIIDYQTNNINDPQKKLKIVIRVITERKMADPYFPDINEAALHRIIIAESDKTYLTKQVDDDNKEGLFRGYKSLCRKIAEIVEQINPEYPYPHALISTVLQASHQQIFFSQHLPSLTEIKYKSKNLNQQHFDFLYNLVIQTIHSR